MRSREILDEAFAQNGIKVEPQLEIDSLRGCSLPCAPGSGRVLLHRRIQTLLSSQSIRAIPRIEPSISASVAVIINAAKPGSAIAQAFMSAASSLTVEDWDAWAAGAPREAAN